VAFEAVFVAHLPGAGLTVPAEPLQAFGLHLVGDVFGGTDFGARHGQGGVGEGTGLVVEGVMMLEGGRMWWGGMKKGVTFKWQA
jgi:hypothetical protein